MQDSIRPTSRDAILEAGFRLLSADPAVSLADIAQYAGVGRATLHRYFPGRDDLLRALALSALAEMDDAADRAAEGATDLADALRRILNALIPLGDRHGFLAHFPMDTDPDITREYERQSRETREMIEAARREGLFNPDLPTAWVERMIDAVILSGWESIRAQESTPAQACDLAWTSLMNGVSAR